MRFLMLALLLMSEGCMSPGRVARPIDESPDRFVRVEARYGDPRREGPTRFAHPVGLNTEEWARILSHIQVQSYQDRFIFTTAKNPAENAFDSGEIAYLSGKLSEAFARAFPDEWVVFGLSRPRSPQLTEITTGGWFIEGTTLHFVLANYRHGVTKAAVREQMWKDPLRAETKLYVELLPSEYVTTGGGKKSLTGFLQEGAELSIDYQGLLKARAAVRPTIPSPIVSPQSPALTPPSKTDPSPPPTQSVEDRLRVLKGLREQGLITEDEYREKKKQILEKF
jgi:hypothetical protein